MRYLQGASSFPLKAFYLEITCPNCGQKSPYVPEFAGRELFCLACGSQFVVPASGEEQRSNDATPGLQKVRLSTEPAPPNDDEATRREP
jgi:ribosomal protein S27E